MFHYYHPPAHFGDIHPAPHVARIAKNVFDTRELMTSIGAGLGFPRFFGKNFDAFWDCVRDLDVGEQRVIVLHRDLPDIPGEDLATYLELLRDASLYWKKHADEHSFETWFPENVRDKVEAALKEIPPPDPDSID